MLYLTQIPASEMTIEERSQLYEARDYLKDKGNKNFPRMIQNVYNGTWDLWRISGAAKGIVVLNPEDGRLNIYYLNGSGLFGKMRQLTKRLMDIAEKSGLARHLTCVTADERKARLFSQTPGTTRRKDGSFWYLELTDGR